MMWSQYVLPKESIIGSRLLITPENALIHVLGPLSLLRTSLRPWQMHWVHRLVMI